MKRAVVLVLFALAGCGLHPFRRTFSLARKPPFELSRTDVAQG